MKERAKAVDDYATTFFANNLCKQLMYPERSQGGALIVGMQSKAPSNASARNRRENTLKGGIFNDLHPEPLPAPSAQTPPVRQLLEARPHMFRSSNR